MHPNTAEAIRSLQSRCLKSRFDDIRQTAIYEYALNELVANPDRSFSTKSLVKSALRNARKKIARRLETFPAYEGNCQLIEDSCPGTSDSYAIDEIHVFDELARSRLHPRERVVLGLFAIGLQADDISKTYDVAPQRAREWISRAKLKGRGLLPAVA